MDVITLNKETFYLLNTEVSLTRLTYYSHQIIVFTGFSSTV